MTNVARIELAYELNRAGQHVDYIAERVGRHRATVYRWLNGTRLYGLREFIRRYAAAKKGRRQPRKTDPVIKQRIYAIRMVDEETPRHNNQRGHHLPHSGAEVPAAQQVEEKPTTRRGAPSP